MDQIDKARLSQLTQKIGVMKGMQMSDEEIEKSFDKNELDLIEKARSHKYIRKEGDRYIYDEKAKHPDTQESIKNILSSSQHDQIKQNKIRDIVGDESAARSIVAENRNKKQSEKKEATKAKYKYSQKQRESFKRIFNVSDKDMDEREWFNQQLAEGKLKQEDYLSSDLSKKFKKVLDK